MKQESKLSWGGQYLVEVKDANGVTKSKKLINNIITNAALVRYSELIAGVNAQAPKYISIGIGTNGQPASPDDVTLINESFRQTFLSSPNLPIETPGQVIFTWAVSFEDIQLAPTIREVGVFALNGIDSEVDIESVENTGLLISRIAVDITLGLGETLFVSRIDTFGRG